MPNSQYPLALDNVIGSADRMHPNLSSVLNNLQQTLGINGAFNFTGWPTRQTASITSGSLAAGASQMATIALSTGYRLLHVATSVAGRVRLYTTVANQSADLSRTFAVSPPEGAGCTFDFMTQSPTLMAADLTPVVDGYSLESTPTTAIPITVSPTNAGAMTVTFTWLRLE